MTKLKSALLTCIVCALLAGVAKAEVKVVTLVFFAASADYIVPAGKVLLIEHLSPWFGNSSGGTFDKVVLSIQSVAENNTALVTIPWSFSTSNAAQSIHLERPLRAAAGSAVNIFDSAAGSAKDVRIQGLLIDQADLYAANLGLDLKDVAVADQKLTATVKILSRRPAILDSEISPDLASWVENLTQIVARRPEPLLFDVSTNIEMGEARKFLQVSARAPELR